MKKKFLFLMLPLMMLFQQRCLVSEIGEETLEKIHSIGIILRAFNAANNKLGWFEDFKKYDPVCKANLSFLKSYKMPGNIREKLPADFHLTLDFLKLFCKSTSSALDKDFDIGSELIDGVSRFFELSTNVCQQTFGAFQFQENGITKKDQVFTKEQSQLKSKLDKRELGIILSEAFARWISRASVNNAFKKNRITKRTLNVIFASIIAGAGAFSREKFAPDELKNFLPDYNVVALDAFINATIVEFIAELFQRAFMLDFEQKSRKRTGHKLNEIALNVYNDLHGRPPRQ